MPGKVGTTAYIYCLRKKQTNIRAVFSLRYYRIAFYSFQMYIGAVCLNSAGYPHESTREYPSYYCFPKDNVQ